jgi:hypothetical protein
VCQRWPGVSEVARCVRDGQVCKRWPGVSEEIGAHAYDTL